MYEAKTNIKALARAFRSVPKRAMASTLNKLAYEAKRTAPDHIAGTMELRARGFVEGAIGYKKTNRSRLEAVWGMATRPRFTGLAAQEKGRTEAKRAPTLLARGGNLASRVKPSNRLRPSTRLVKSDDFRRPMKSNAQRIAILRKTKYKGLVVLPKEGRHRLGIYKLVGGKKFKRARLVQALGDLPPVKKRPWMKKTNEALFRSGVFRKAWVSNMRRGITDMLRRGAK